jgi:hypothetical protein
MRYLMIAAAITGCGGNAPWQDKDTTSETHIVQLAKGCEALCLSDAGCTPEQAAGCLDAIGCNGGSMLHRHGAPTLVPSDAGCTP